MPAEGCEDADEDEAVDGACLAVEWDCGWSWEWADDVDGGAELRWCG